MRRRVWVARAVCLTIGASAGGAAGWILRGDQSPPSAKTPFIPPRAQLLDLRDLHTGGPEEVAAAWVRFTRSNPFGTFGVAIWKRPTPASRWQRIYSRSMTGAKEYNFNDIQLRAADLTLDGSDELIVLEDLDGSAGSYNYRVLRVDGLDVRQLEARQTSEDQTTIVVEPGALISYDGVGKDPRTLTAIHCCPRYWRRTVKRWNGRRLVETGVSRVETRPAGRYVESY